jgi:hypothetical protein
VLPALVTAIPRLLRCQPQKIPVLVTLGIRFAVLVQPRDAALFYIVINEHRSIHARSIRVGDLLPTV